MIFRSRYSIGKVSSRGRSLGASFERKRRFRQKFYFLFKRIFIIFFGGGFLGFLILLCWMWYLSGSLPDVDRITTYIPAETTKIISEDGVILAELHQEENRVLIPIEKISPVLIKTLVAVEDSRFYKHHGLDFIGIGRALYKDIIAGAFVEGGSTLTQQLARNLFLHRRRKLNRKLSEAMLAVQIERKYTKTEILEMYLNQVYWGHNAYGIESASWLYFNKKSADLNLAESSMLVGLLKGPELYSPLKNLKRAKKRQRVILNRMVGIGLITSEQAQKAYLTELVLASRKKFRYKAPYFTSYIIKQLIEMYGEEATYTSGMKVYTTLNYRLQEHGEKVAQNWVDYGQKTHWVKDQKVPSLNYEQAALLALDPRNGGVKVMVGGVDFLEHQYNRCVQSKRQPGSAFKPFVYLAALKEKLSPGSFVEDAPVTFNTIEGPYSPRNYTEKFLGNLPLRKALERSVNVIAIKLNYLVGPDKVVQVAQDLGIRSPLKPILSLPLGANEVSMLELVSAYGVIANHGLRVEPYGIKEIKDREGTVLYEAEVIENRVADGNTVSALVEMLRGVMKYGTGRNALIPRPAAGKTGTTSDYRDAWFVGFVPQLVCAAWVGNDDNTPTYKMTGGWVPARMWRDFMKEAVKDFPAQGFTDPRGMVFREVDWDTGALATEYSAPDRVTKERYWAGFEPQSASSKDSSLKLKKDQLEEQQLFDFFESF